ncbi:MAG: bifunctional glutamate N-acetyltransferase/amino-acid acetyltransferase ArgJ [Treponema sp.]|jgi:glutamate N-acetyltransferase/amino-acid N-acetyltransferase|nr:bifunctional glutamate N-acetyltransferase/amino-acid acetyltransferase ArgJ [Treponema sp.]
MKEPEDMKEPERGVCAPRGFRAGGVCCGIKARGGKRDLALICSDGPCVSAGVFTTNRVQAANILVSREHSKAGKIRAVIANSGNANACTGQAGLAAARRMALLAAESLGISAGETAVASTGVIGVPLPVEKIEAAMDRLTASLDSGPAGHDAALEAIMTTDTRKKAAAVELPLPGSAGPVRIGAMVKGSGMIHPNMATMIGIITTDAAVGAGELDRALRRAVNRSFNRLTVDGDTSTNDMVLAMANGAAGNPLIAAEGPAYEAFAGALEALCIKLARAMARDGEGAGRLLTVTVEGAASEEDAAVLARSVAGSSLVKAACFGADANWGRVLCALGYAGVPFEPERTSVRFAGAPGSVTVCRDGCALPFSEEDAKRILLEEEIEILAVVGNGPGAASAWGCDLSYDYVKINGDYRS